MRLGPKEKQILKRLSPGKFTPPSEYLGEYGDRSPWPTLNRLVYDKGLAAFRFQTLTPEERLRAYRNLAPGREAAEYNAALRLTPKGEEVIKKLKEL